MQPTIDQLTQVDGPLGLVSLVLGRIKAKAEHAEDGNTVALLSRIARDIATLKQEYTSLKFGDLFEAGEEEETPVSEQDPAFVHQSYVRAQHKDVNQAPYPQTGEDASAPFVNKGEIKGEALKNADNSEEERASGSKSGKLTKAPLA